MAALHVAHSSKHLFAVNNICLSQSGSLPRYWGSVASNPSCRIGCLSSRPGSSIPFHMLRYQMGNSCPSFDDRHARAGHTVESPQAWQLRASTTSEDKSAATPTEHLRPPTGRDPLEGVGVMPVVVMRDSKVPENWNGPGGTVVLIDKPKNWTSFDVCGKLRYLLKIQKVGHAGTLDPMATGLLVVCVGKATKLADSYQALTKVYSGTMRLGECTPSCDADTPVSQMLPWQHIEDADIERAKQAFIGQIMQVPPMFSAIKVQGERLYNKARRGEEIKVPPRAVTIYDFQLKRSPETRQELDFVVVCSKGTYIRSLCADLGQSLDSFAHLTALRRDKIGNLSVEDAWPVAELVEHYQGLKSVQIHPAQN